eukprot:5903163-Pleurochrysis_carterae.AAC.1
MPTGFVLLRDAVTKGVVLVVLDLPKHELLLLFCAAYLHLCFNAMNTRERILYATLINNEAYTLVPNTTVCSEKPSVRSEARGAQIVLSWGKPCLPKLLTTANRCVTRQKVEKYSLCSALQVKMLPHEIQYRASKGTHLITSSNCSKGNEINWRDDHRSKGNPAARNDVSDSTSRRGMLAPSP